MLNNMKTATTKTSQRPVSHGPGGRTSYYCGVGLGWDIQGALLLGWMGYTLLKKCSLVFFILSFPQYWNTFECELIKLEAVLILWYFWWQLFCFCFAEKSCVWSLYSVLLNLSVFVDFVVIPCISLVATVAQPSIKSTTVCFRIVMQYVLYYQR